LEISNKRHKNFKILDVYIPQKLKFFLLLFFSKKRRVLIFILTFTLALKKQRELAAALAIIG